MNIAEAGAVAAAAYLVCVNAIAFVAFGVDKSRSRKSDARRIPERTLMLLAVAGGSLGAFAGMRAFHHKTRKPLFAIGVPVLLAVTAALLAACVSGGLLRGR